MLSGWTCTPSATEPAIRSIHGFTAATSMGGSGTSIEPGDHMAGRSERFQNSPSWASGAPRNAAKIARSASTYSCSRGPGCSKSLP